MKTYYPVRPYHRTQPFGANYNTYYAEAKLKGHTGEDINCFHRQPILSICDGEVFAVQHGSSDPMVYRAGYVLWEGDGVAYEINYGHADKVLVNVGDKVKVGTPIILGGNTGSVTGGGRKITKAEKLAGSTSGTHLHLNIRLVKPVPKKESGKVYLKNDKGDFKKNGMFYEVQNADNGFRGGIDPSQFWTGQYADGLTSVPTITQTLRYGSRGDQVKILQKKLGLKVDGIFGTKTEKAVKDFQAKYHLKVDGIFGIISRTILEQL